MHYGRAAPPLLAVFGHRSVGRVHVRKRPALRAASGDDAGVKPADYARLVLLAAIWGGSFIFQRIASLLGNALGMVLYFRLIADVGATRALF